MTIQVNGKDVRHFWHEYNLTHIVTDEGPHLKLPAYVVCEGIVEKLESDDYAHQTQLGEMHRCGPSCERPTNQQIVNEYLEYLAGIHLTTVRSPDADSPYYKSLTHLVEACKREGRNHDVIMDQVLARWRRDAKNEPTND